MFAIVWGMSDAVWQTQINGEIMNHEPLKIQAGVKLNKLCAVFFKHVLKNKYGYNYVKYT